MKVKKVKFDEQVIKIMAAGGANSKDVEKLQEEYNDLYNAFPKTTDEGEPITLETAKAPMNIDLKGNTSQDGEPTPSSPVPVKVVTGNNTIEVVGINLFDGEMELGKISSSGAETVSSINIRAKNYTQVEENTEYFLSTNLSDNNYTRNYIYCYDENKTFLSVITKSKTSSFTTLEKTKHIRFRPDLDSSDTSVKFWLNKGTTALPYTPYQSQTYQVNLGELELCKIGDYQDYFYKDSGKWYLRKAIGNVVLNGSETWVEESVGDYKNFAQAFTRSLGNNNAIVCLSKYFTGVTGSQSYSGTINNAIGIGNSKTLRIRTSNFSDLATFKTWLGNNNTLVYYVLATPITTEITDTTLIEQLEALKQANSYNKQTNISSTYEEGNAPFIIAASALYDLNNLMPTNTRTLSIGLNKMNNKNIDLNAVEEIEEIEEEKENIEEEATEE